MKLVFFTRQVENCFWLVKSKLSIAIRLARKKGSFKPCFVPSSGDCVSWLSLKHTFCLTSYLFLVELPQLCETCRY